MPTLHVSPDLLARIESFAPIARVVAGRPLTTETIAAVLIEAGFDALVRQLWSGADAATMTATIVKLGKADPLRNRSHPGE